MTPPNAPTATGECPHLSVRFETVAPQLSTSAMALPMPSFQRTLCADCGAIRLATGEWRMPNATAARDTALSAREREIAARLEAATPGDWFAMPHQGSVWGPTDWLAQCYAGTHRQRAANAEFMAHSREDVEYLLSALLAARRENERLRAKLDVIQSWRLSTPLTPGQDAALAALAAADPETKYR